jgi:hypothetical protein
MVQIVVTDLSAAAVAEVEWCARQTKKKLRHRNEFYLVKGTPNPILKFIGRPIFLD